MGSYKSLIISLTPEKEITTGWKQIFIQKDKYLQLTACNRSDVPNENGTIYLDSSDNHLYININGTWKQII